MKKMATKSPKTSFGSIAAKKATHPTATNEYVTSPKKSQVTSPKKKKLKLFYLLN
jgi:hypothetical protein